MPQPRFVFAVFNFPGTTEEDLPLVAGERIEVISRDDEFGDGWWEGVNERGQQGLFPKIYTSESYPIGSSAAASQSSLNDSLSRVDEEPESEVSAEQNHGAMPVSTSAGSQTSTKPTIEAVQNWSPEDVSRHFALLGLQDVAPNFTEHEVSGRILLEMQHTDLREIDINAFGKRFEIMREIDVLRRTDLSTPMFSPDVATDSGASTPPLDFSQRSNARKSRLLPQPIDTTDLHGSKEELDSDGVRPLVPRSGDSSPQLQTLAPSLAHDSAGHARTDSGLGSSVNSNLAEATPSITTSQASASNASNAPNSSHRRSMSTSAILLGSNRADTANGRRSPDKRHSRTWSQDTVKINSHKRGASAGLGPVGEEVAASLVSSDSIPRSPSSPASNALSSPSSAKPSSLTKKSILGRRPKWKPNAVSENLEKVSAAEAAKDADFSGWMRKRGEKSYNWKVRYFVLRGTRLSYYTSDRDASEKGIIDINSHKASTVDDILFYGPSRNTFKLTPPAPGASRSLNFTPPKTHFFCVETKDQLRQWIAVITKATIGRDWSTPVISSCTTKTISLKAARDARGVGSSQSSSGRTLEPGFDMDNLPDPQVLSPDEVVAQHRSKTPDAQESVGQRQEGHLSDSSLRRAVLNVPSSSTADTS